MNPILRFRGLPPEKRLSLFLWVVAVHSIAVGIVLVAQPAQLIRMIGFDDINESFFPCQGGVFHMVMAIAYIYGAIDIHKNKNLVIYAIIVKMAATVFLLSYYFLIERRWVILLSGIIDFFMGAGIWGLFGYASFRSDARKAAAS